MRFARRFLILSLSAAAAVGAYAKPVVHVSPQGPISAERMSQDIKVLSSDAFQGRSPATEGETRTTEWLIARCKSPWG